MLWHSGFLFLVIARFIFSFQDSIPGRSEILARLELKNVTKQFGNIVAVDRVSLEVNDREFVVLLGPSGCGKTTTLRCIAGLEEVDDGEIVVDEKVMNEVPPQDRNIGMVFQDYALYPHMSVRRNLAFPLETRKVSKGEIHRKVVEVSKLLRIEELLDRKPAKLSGGQKQRVALGRAIIREPILFLMDEPLSSLDAKLRLYMRGELKTLQRNLGVTTIYVTHDQVEAMTMGDRLALMEGGRLQQYETPDRIYDHPTNRFVAGFIGSPPMNFIECSLTERNTLLWLEAGEFRFELGQEIAEIVKKEATSSELTVGIRPENIFVNNSKVENSLEFRVYVIEYLGKETLMSAKLGDNILRIMVPGFVSAGVNDKVWLTFDKNAIYVIDRRTGKALVY